MLGRNSIFDLCPTLAELTRTGKTVGKSGKIHEARGALSTVNNLHTIHTLMRDIQPSHTLEVGMSFGGSALAFCASHKELGHPQERQHIAIDPYEMSPTCWDCAGVLAVERANLSGYLDFREGCSSLELPKLLESGQRFGLIYIDGSHLFEDVFIDAYFATRLLTDGGVVLLDDSFNKHVKKVLRFLRTNSVGLQEKDLGEYRTDRLKHAVASLIGKVNLTAFQRVGDIDREWFARFRRF